MLTSFPMKTIFFLLCFFPLILLSQKEDHQWVFHFSGINDTIEYREWTASVLDFNHLPPRGIWNPEITMDMKECHACFCDENGELLVYSNGQTIHGPNHQPVTNGDTINYSPRWDACLLYTSPSPRDLSTSRMPSSA